MINRRFLFLAVPFLIGWNCWANEKWVYVADNLLVDERARQVEALISRAGKAGYTHVLLADSKYDDLGAVSAVINSGGR